MKTNLFLVLFALASIHLQAQVTIGSGKEPLKGALLDMKQYEMGEAGKSDGLSTSDKGMLLPRVALQGFTDLEPIAITASVADKRVYKGMAVYNTTTNTTKNLEEGIYYFDGTKWVKQLTSLPATATNTEPWRIMGGTTEATTPADNIYVNGNVNIGSQTTQSAYKLQVSGNMHTTATQTVGGIIGVGTISPKVSASIDLAASDKALKLNNVGLLSSTDITTVNAPVAGMTVYNTSNVSDVTPGMYYFDGFKWTRLVTTAYSGSSINLRNLQAPVTSNVTSTGMDWAKGSLMNFGVLTIPESGSYAFSFRLYGEITPGSSVVLPFRCVYYIYLMADNVCVDSAEMDITVAAPTAYSYSVTLGSSLSVGQNITFRLSHYQYDTPWALRNSNSNMNPVRTSMLWWKL